MTLVVVFQCSDGAVLATDSMLTNTMGNLSTAETTGKKVYLAPEQQLFAFAGDPGLAHRFLIMLGLVAPDMASAEIPLDYSARISCAVAQQFASTNLPPPFDINAAVAFPHTNQPYTVWFDHLLQPRFLDVDHYWFALGTGKQYADPFLAFLTRVFCPQQPSVDEAKFLATWALEHTIETNTGGVDRPIQMATLTRNAEGVFIAAEISEAEIDDQNEAISDARQNLRDWRDAIRGGEVQPTDEGPPVPLACLDPEGDAEEADTS